MWEPLSVYLLCVHVPSCERAWHMRVSMHKGVKKKVGKQDAFLKSVISSWWAWLCRAPGTGSFLPLRGGSNLY